jgi:GT2 family glycosyltransferase
VELAFVLARRQNHFFVEIVEAIRDELEQLGIASSVHRDGFPPERDDLVYVLVPPHEWFALDAWRGVPTTSQLARTAFICAEQPETAFFVDDVALAPLAGAVLDVSEIAIREFQRAGVSDVRHFPLGWTRLWSHVPTDDDGRPIVDGPERDIDALHLGIYSYRRAVALAAAGRVLSRWNCRLVLSDDDVPNFAQQANFAKEDVKWDLLRRSKVLLNIHVAERPYFEWQRIVQAIGNGCTIVTEHSVGSQPLEPGRHFLGGRAEAVGLLAHGLLDDPDRRSTMARAAFDFLRSELPLSASVTTLVEAADEILSRRRAAREPVSELPLPELMAPQTRGDHPPEAPTEFPSTVDDPQASVVRAAIKDMRLELLSMRRDLDRWRLERDAGGRLPAIELVERTRAYVSAGPRVSVVVPLYNYEGHIAAALESVAAGSYADVEIVVVDDGSTDGSLAAARGWLRRHEGIPALLVRHPVNRGLGAARNAAVDFARGELCFMLDADNETYRRGLARLVSALDADPMADFAYGMLEMFSVSGPVGLRSYFPWRPDRLRTGNFVDAMALWRTAALRALGGYTTDRRLHGWEDYDLWCRVAERGGRGAFVPQIVARYRVSAHSMLSLTDISSRTAVSLLIERHPKLMAGMHPPM